MILDLETTGLHPETDRIIELGALRVEDSQITDRMSVLVRCDAPLPREVKQLTGISDQMLAQDGVGIRTALERFAQFAGDAPLLGYNVAFDLEFLHAALRRAGLPALGNRSRDLLRAARRKADGLRDYKLGSVAAHFSLPAPQLHRALPDCELVYQLAIKLNEI